MYYFKLTPLNGIVHIHIILNSYPVRLTVTTVLFYLRAAICEASVNDISNLSIISFHHYIAHQSLMPQLKTLNSLATMLTLIPPQRTESSPNVSKCFDI